MISLDVLNLAEDFLSNLSKCETFENELYNEGITSVSNLSERTNIPLSTMHREVRNIENGKKNIEHKKEAGTEMNPRVVNVGGCRRVGVLVSKNRGLSSSIVRCELI